MKKLKSLLKVSMHPGSKGRNELDTFLARTKAYLMELEGGAFIRFSVGLSGGGDAISRKSGRIDYLASDRSIRPNMLMRTNSRLHMFGYDVL